MHLEMKIMPTRRLITSLEGVPEGPGVYVVLVDQAAWTGRAWPRAKLYVPLDGQAWGALYVGATADCLRIRIKSHLANDSQASTMRMSLGLLLLQELRLQIRPLLPARYFCFDDEKQLTEWLVTNTLVGFAVTSRAFAVEKELIGLGGGLLNLRGAPESSLTGWLRKWREAASVGQSPPFQGWRPAFTFDGVTVLT